MLRNGLMNSWVGVSLLAGALLVAAGVQAQERGEPVTISKSDVDEGSGSFINDELFSVRPVLGVILYSPTEGDDATRPAFGLLMNWNVMPLLSDELTQGYLGIASGVIFSHLGPADAGFFGAGDGRPGSDSNMYMVPLNIKAGFTFADDFRLAIHGGANAIYRTNGFSMAIGNDDNSAAPQLGFFPNIGADVVIAIGRNAALTFRPDMTITDVEEIFTGTIGLAFPLG